MIHWNFDFEVLAIRWHNTSHSKAQMPIRHTSKFHFKSIEALSMFFLLLFIPSLIPFIPCISINGALVLTDRYNKEEMVILKHSAMVYDFLCKQPHIFPFSLSKKRNRSIDGITLMLFGSWFSPMPLFGVHHSSRGCLVVCICVCLPMYFCFWDYSKQIAMHIALEFLLHLKWKCLMCTSKSTCRFISVC